MIVFFIAAGEILDRIPANCQRNGLKWMVIIATRNTKNLLLSKYIETNNLHCKFVVVIFFLALYKYLQANRMLFEIKYEEEVKTNENGPLVKQRKIISF